MNAKKTDLKELEGWYAKSGNQLMLLYGGMDCRKEHCESGAVEHKAEKS